MKKIFKNRTLVLIAVLMPILALFAYTALRSGPLAPIPVTVAAVENIAIAPAVFGIGTVEARFIHRIGPTVAGRVERLEVHVGDRVEAGQVLGRMDGIDLDERIQALEAAIARAGANLSAAEARIADAEATFGGRVGGSDGEPAALAGPAGGGGGQRAALPGAVGGLGGGRRRAGIRAGENRRLGPRRPYPDPGRLGGRAAGGGLQPPRPG